MEIITDPFFYLVGIPAVLIAGVSKSGFGGGLGVMAVPLMALALSPQAAAGFTSFVAHAGGPPVSVFLLPQRMDKTVFVGTTVMFFIVVNYVKLIPYWYLGQFGGANLGTALVLVPVALFGTWLGLWAHDKVNAKLFYRVCYTLLFVTGLKLLSDAVMHFAAI